MAKEIVAQIKLYVPAGKANPAPPVGPALGQHGVNIMGFCKEFNEKTKGRDGIILPAVISVYKDKSFTFILKSPPSSVLIKKAANLAKASGLAGKEKIGKITKQQIKDIVKIKIEDLNTKDYDQAMLMVEGTARSMGVEVVD
jgi:large subunit ribosomal protein L11